MTHELREQILTQDTARELFDQYVKDLEERRNVELNDLLLKAHELGRHQGVTKCGVAGTMCGECRKVTHFYHPVRCMVCGAQPCAYCGICGRCEYRRARSTTIERVEVLEDWREVR